MTKIHAVAIDILTIEHPVAGDLTFVKSHVAVVVGIEHAEADTRRLRLTLILFLAMGLHRRRLPVR